MAVSKKFSEWEKEVGLFAVDVKQFNPKDEYTKEEFMTLYAENTAAFVGVSYDDRVQFLEDNGYKVTRENLLADLSVKPKED